MEDSWIKNTCAAVDGTLDYRKQCNGADVDTRLFDSPALRKPTDDPFATSFLCNQLREALFADSNAAEGINTYAVLDPNRILGLTDQLKALGCEARMLFNNKHSQNYDEISPWIVNISPDDRVTRNLLTTGSGPSHWWERKTGIFIQYPGNIDEVRQHLRYFTRIQSANKNWLFFRFWEPSVLLYLTFSHCDAPSQKNSILPKLVGNTNIVIPITEQRQLVSVKAKNFNDNGKASITLTQRDRECLTLDRWHHFCRKVHQTLSENEFNNVTLESVQYACNDVYALGFRVEKSILFVAKAMLLNKERTLYYHKQHKPVFRDDMGLARAVYAFVNEEKMEYL